MIRRRVGRRIAGARTDYRVNCLFEATPLSAAGETCVVSHAWWRQPYFGEGFASTRHACCDDRIRTNYSLGRLQEHARGGLRLAFTRGYESSDRALSALLGSSGGNALVAAIGLCERVDVYGYGLLSSDGAPVSGVSVRAPCALHRARVLRSTLCLLCTHSPARWPALCQRNHVR
jgi:hypothetical protein